MRIGDPVLVAREAPGEGTWERYAGRRGWVASINRQRFPDGSSYVEYGVTFTHRRNMVKAAAEAWFRPTELESR